MILFIYLFIYFENNTNKKAMLPQGNRATDAILFDLKFANEFL